MLPRADGETVEHIGIASTLVPWELLLQCSSDLVTVHDEDGTVLFANAAADPLLGRTPDSLIGLNASELVHPDDWPHVLEQLTQLERRPGEVAMLQLRAQHHDGTYRHVESLVRNGLRDQALQCLVISTRDVSGREAAERALHALQHVTSQRRAHDVSERVRTRQRLARLASFQRAVLDSLPSLTVVVNRSGTIIETNDAWNRHLHERGGPPPDSGVGQDFLHVCAGAVGPSLSEAHQVAAGLQSLLAGEVSNFQQDVACQLPDDTMLFFSLHMVPLNSPEGGAVINYTDITERKKLEVDAAHRATHDVLTGLPNRVLLLERLEHSLEHRNDTAVALLFLDLDSFKLVNDGYGHDAGDAVLQELAGRLQENVRPADTVARLAGDEFVVLCEDLPHVTEAHLLADRLIQAISEPFPLGDTTITLGVSIGIAVSSETDQDPAALLRAADQAMFDAKARGRNRFAIYDADVRGRNTERLEQAMTLRRLVEDDDLLVHYQPVIDLRDGHYTGAEALLRWRGGQGLPDSATAITLAEEVGLIGRIGAFVLHEATRQAATFLTPQGTVLPLSINLAPQQLNRGFVAALLQATDRAGYPLTSVTLELTERSFMVEPVLAIDVLRSLRRLGVRIALDDFGVGYSSLAALRDLPLDVLKIDMSFVRGLVGPGRDDRLVRAIIQMAAALDLDIVAEGIELVEQRDRLLDLGCRHGQGFLYSPARAPDVLRAQVLG